MEKTYTTKQGDAWDAIAFQVYGDVIYTGFLMQANFPHLDTFVFDAGMVMRMVTEVMTFMTMFKLLEIMEA